MRKERITRESFSEIIKFLSTSDAQDIILQTINDREVDQDAVIKIIIKSLINLLDNNKKI